MNYNAGGDSHLPRKLAEELVGECIDHSLPSISSSNPQSAQRESISIVPGMDRFGKYDISPHLGHFLGPIIAFIPTN